MSTEKKLRVLVGLSRVRFKGEESKDFNPAQPVKTKLSGAKETDFFERLHWLSLVGSGTESSSHSFSNCSASSSGSGSTESIKKKK